MFGPYSFKFECLVFLITTLAIANASDHDIPNLLTGGFSRRLHHLDPPNHKYDSKSARDQWFEQRLDHFNGLNTKTWQQRYFTKYGILNV